MLSIGGVIGPGYFVEMGDGLSNAGAAGLLLSFTIVGALLWCVMQCLGELGAFISVAGELVPQGINPNFCTCILTLIRLVHSLHRSFH